MLTVGGDLMQLSPVAAWVVVVSHSIVLFLFASEGLEHLLASYGLPTIPLVPVSSSQAVVGAVVWPGNYARRKEYSLACSGQDQCRLDYNTDNFSNHMFRFLIFSAECIQANCVRSGSFQTIPCRCRKVGGIQYFGGGFPGYG